MDKHNEKNSFCKMIEPISFNQLLKALQERIEQANAYVKKFDFHSFLKLMLFAVSKQKDSLRDINADIHNPKFQTELGFESLSCSQISRTLRRFDPAILEDLFFYLLTLIHQEEAPSRLPKAFLIDSTTFPLNKTRYPWVEFRKTKSGVKMHLRLAYVSAGDTYPDKLTVTNAKVHDVNQIEILIDQKIATYAFDRGYLDFELFDKLSNDGFFFVTRIKRNKKFQVMEQYDVPQESAIVSDRMVVLGGNNAYLTEPYRLVEVNDTKGNPLGLVTNRFDLSAEEIGQMYRARWQIELFFKHLKQTDHHQEIFQPG